MKDNKPEDLTEAHPPETDIEFSHWRIPDITEAPPEDASNLFGRKMVQKIIIEQQESILPPTLIQIEEIRLEAEKEGFAQGKEEGHQVGLEVGRLEGLKQGHDEGFEQGIEQGYQEGAQKALVLVKRFEGLLEQFNKPLELLDNEIEQELVSLTLKLSRSVIYHEMNTHPEHVLAALRQGVDSLSLRGQEVVIRLHPDDHQLVQELYTINQLEKNRWDLEIDPSLSRGDCMILSQRSSVDMRLESRINAVLEELEHHHESLNQAIEQQKQSCGSPSETNKFHPVESAINTESSETSELTDAADNIGHQVLGDKSDNQVSDVDSQIDAAGSDHGIDDVGNHISGDKSDNQVSDVDSQMDGAGSDHGIDDVGNHISGDKSDNKIDEANGEIPVDDIPK